MHLAHTHGRMREKWLPAQSSLCKWRWWCHLWQIHSFLLRDDCGTFYRCPALFVFELTSLRSKYCCYHSHFTDGQLEAWTGLPPWGHMGINRITGLWTSVELAQIGAGTIVPSAFLTRCHDISSYFMVTAFLHSSYFLMGGLLYSNSTAFYLLDVTEGSWKFA